MIDISKEIEAQQLINKTAKEIANRLKTMTYLDEQIGKTEQLQTPTLEEVKEYFKNAKEVKCVNSEDIGFIEFEKIEQNRKLDGNIIGYVQNAMTKNWLVLWDSQKGYAEIISYKDEPIDAGSCIKDFETPKHYDNSKGSIYKFCENKNLNSYEFDIIKRVVRCRKKGNFKEDLQKTKHLIDLYLSEYEN